MALPEVLGEQISAARMAISRANSIDREHLIHNARVYLETALSHVKATPEIQDAASNAMAAVRHFRAQDGGFGLSDTERDNLESARQTALNAIDAFAVSLTAARPSEIAEAIGLGWW